MPTTTPPTGAINNIARPTLPELPEVPVLDPLPEVEQRQVARLSTPALPEIAPEHTVQGRIAALTTQRNPLLTAARTRATQRAHGRGLISSTMAEQAGTGAVIEAALPIASQDAAAEQRRQELGFQAEQRRGEIQFQEDEAAKREMLASTERRDELEFSAKANIDLSVFDATTRQNMAKFEADTRSFEGQLDRDFQSSTIADAEIAGHKVRYQDGVTGIRQHYGNLAMQIKTTPDSVMSPEQKQIALDDNDANQRAAMETHNNLFSPDLITGWDESWEVLPSEPVVREPTPAPAPDTLDEIRESLPAGEPVASLGEFGAEFYAKVEPAKTIRTGGELNSLINKAETKEATPEDLEKLIAHIKWGVAEQARRGSSSTYYVDLENRFKQWYGI